MNDSRHEFPRIYLDNAATSWPKPAAMYDAVDHYQRRLGAPAGRGAYAEATEVSALVDGARLQLARLIGLNDPRHLVFTFNGTDSLNLAIHGLLRAGDHVVTSVIEHNSVLRPLDQLESAGTITTCRVRCDSAGIVAPEDVQAALATKTRLVILSHASNVTGAIQPIAEISQLAHAAGALVLCDAAQTLGHLRVDMNELGVDFLAASGHKGLMGQLGTGLLAIRPDCAAQLDSVRQGGTGTRSGQSRQPSELPDKFESGNLNVPGIVGLKASVGYLVERGLDNMQAHGERLTARLLDAFADIKNLKVWGPTTARDRVPLVSISLAGYDPQEVAVALDAAYRIQVRAGLHCAPAMHAALGTEKTGGTVRFSLGGFSSEAEIDAAAAAVRVIASSEMLI